MHEPLQLKHIKLACWHWGTKLPGLILLRAFESPDKKNDLDVIYVAGPATAGQVGRETYLEGKPYAVYPKHYANEERLTILQTVLVPAFHQPRRSGQASGIDFSEEGGPNL